MAVTNTSVNQPPPRPSDYDKVDELKPATETAASGALIEPEIVSRIDTTHPAVDDNPRAGQSVAANRIDFNDPTLSGQEAVKQRLEQQGSKVASNLGVDPPAEDKPKA